MCQQPQVTKDDLETMRENSGDFLGVNTYFPTRVGKKPRDAQSTVNNWEIYPDGLYDMVKWIDEEYNHPEMYITENGMSSRCGD